MTNDYLEELKKEIDALPVGYISKKSIHGNTCHYRQWKEDGKVKSQYIPHEQVDYIARQINERKNLEATLRIETYRLKAQSDSKAIKRLYEYGTRLHLRSQVPIGVQYYEDLISKNLFYIDKTHFIADWWDTGDKITLITRPRRFGKTLGISMLDCFFSMLYKDRSDLFDKFEIWGDERFRMLQGTFPTIFISFGGVKEDNAKGQLLALRDQVHHAFSANRFIMDNLSAEDCFDYKNYLSMFNYTEEMILSGLNKLCEFFYKAYKKKTIILIDEYDTPILEAWVAGALDECSNNMRLFFNKTLKANPYIEKALLTGITRISKESFFSDLNHLEVCTMTSPKYDYAFGFTEDEVKLAMKEQKLDNFEEVKAWYDGFTIGNRTDIYNPWSITNYLSKKVFKPYWVNTSSNAMINSFFQEGDSEVKQTLEDLINGKSITTMINEEMIFSHIPSYKSALWSLLFFSGYLRIIDVINPEFSNSDTTLYRLKVTNREVRIMLLDFIRSWFDLGYASGRSDFIDAMLAGSPDLMQEYLERIIRSTFSYFDVSGNEPEKFYHGFVLGIVISQENRFIITSNRESGLGRYDVVLIPRNPQADHAIILEFKIHRPRVEADLKETALNALRQINDKDYEADIINHGINRDNIIKYGIAFKGKEIWIESDHDYY